MCMLESTDFKFVTFESLVFQKFLRRDVARWTVTPSSIASWLTATSVRRPQWNALWVMSEFIMDMNAN